MKKALLSLVILTALIAFGATQAEAVDTGAIGVTATITTVMDITVAPTEVWAIGSVGLGDAATLTTGSVTSELGNTTLVDLEIKCSNATNWTLGGAAASEVFEMKATGGTNGDFTGGAFLTTSDGQTLETDVAPGAAAVTFDLDFKAPTATLYGGDLQSITVTLTAINA